MAETYAYTPRAVTFLWWGIDYLIDPHLYSC